VKPVPAPSLTIPIGEIPLKKLAPKQARFVEEYLVDSNATQAAIRAGYSKKTAEQIGHKLVKKSLVAAAIAKAKAKRSERLEITADMLVRELWIIGHSDIKDYVSIDEGGAIVAKMFEEMPEGASRALEMIEENRTIKESADGKDSNILNSKIRFKMHSKLGAIELISKLLGFMKDKVEHTGKDGGPVEHEVQFIMPRPGEKPDKK
jgi:phage terminase small subunit